MNKKSTIYRFSNIHLNTQNRELFANNTLVKIEPLLFDLLEVFVQQPRTLITRDELIEQVWQQGFVDDNAINRAISELRKTIKQHCNVANLLRTHYKKGYSLQIDVEHFDVPSEPLYQITTKEASREKTDITEQRTNFPDKLETHEKSSTYTASDPTLTKWALGQYKLPLFVLLFCIATTLVILKLPRSGQPSRVNDTIAIETKAITWLKGQTVYPTMQRDGEHLAFAYRKNANKNWQLMIKNLSNDNRLTLNEENIDFFPLSWHQDTLIFQKTHGDTSEIWRVDIANAPLSPHKLLALPTTKYASATLSKDKSELFFIQENSISEPSRVLAANLATGEQYTLSTPRPGSVGDYFLQKSPDGNKLALLRTDNWRKTQIYIIDLESDSTRRVYESNTMIYSIVWDNDNHTLRFMKPQGALYKLNIVNLSVEKQKLSYNKPIEYLALYKANQLLVTSDTMFYQDIFYKSSCQYLSDDPSQADSTIVNSSYADFSPAFHKQLAFVSKRSGSNQIWLRMSNGQERVLSNFNNIEKISFLNWSTDGNNLLGIADNKIFIFNLETKHTKYLDAKGQSISSPTWSPDARYIYYTRTYNNKWNIWKYDLTNDLSEQVSFNGGVSPKFIENLGLVYLSETGNELKSIDETGTEKSLIDGFSIFDTTSWTIVKNKLYYPEHGKIVSVDMTSLEKTICDSAEGFFKHFTTESQGGFYYTLMADNQTNILSIELPN